MPPFVDGFTRWMYQNQIWKWRWEWSSTYKFYYVTDLNIECPNLSRRSSGLGIYELSLPQMKRFIRICYD